MFGLRILAVNKGVPEERAKRELCQVSTLVVMTSTARQPPNNSAKITIWLVLNVPCAERTPVSYGFIQASTAASSRQFITKLAPATRRNLDTATPMTTIAGEETLVDKQHPDKRSEDGQRGHPRLGDDQ